MRSEGGSTDPDEGNPNGGAQHDCQEPKALEVVGLLVATQPCDCSSAGAHDYRADYEQGLRLR